MTAAEATEEVSPPADRAPGYAEIPIRSIIAEGNIRDLDLKSAEQKELADSIATHGVLQPVVVTREGDEYRLIAGFRRVAGARMAKLTTVPAVVRQLTTEEQAEVRMVENIQRLDLSGVEEARAMNAYIGAGHKVSELARRVGKSTSYVNARLALLKLPESVQKLVENGKITASHAETLAGLPNDDQGHRAMEQLAREAAQWRSPVSEFNDQVARVKRQIAEERKLQSLADTSEFKTCPVPNCGKKPTRLASENVVGTKAGDTFMDDAGHVWDAGTGKEPKWQVEGREGKHRARNERAKAAAGSAGRAEENEEDTGYGLVAPAVRSPHLWRTILDALLDYLGDERLVAIEIGSGGFDGVEPKLTLRFGEGKPLLTYHDSVAHLGLFPAPYTTGHKTQVLALSDGDDDTVRAELAAWTKWERANLPAMKEPKAKDAPITADEISALLAPKTEEVLKALPDDATRKGAVEDPAWREKLELIRAAEVEGRDRKGLLIPIDRALRGPCGREYYG